MMPQQPFPYRAKVIQHFKHLAALHLLLESFRVFMSLLPPTVGNTHGEYVMDCHLTAILEDLIGYGTRHLQAAQVEQVWSSLTC